MWYLFFFKKKICNAETVVNCKYLTSSRPCLGGSIVSLWLQALDWRCCTWPRSWPPQGRSSWPSCPWQPTTGNFNEYLLYMSFFVKLCEDIIYKATFLSRASWQETNLFIAVTEVCFFIICVSLLGKGIFPFTNTTFEKKNTIFFKNPLTLVTQYVPAPGTWVFPLMLEMNTTDPLVFLRWGMAALVMAWGEATLKETSRRNSSEGFSLIKWPGLKMPMLLMRASIPGREGLYFV